MKCFTFRNNQIVAGILTQPDRYAPEGIDRRLVFLGRGKPGKFEIVRLSDKNGPRIVSERIISAFPYCVTKDRDGNNLARPFVLLFHPDEKHSDKKDNRILLRVITETSRKCDIYGKPSCGTAYGYGVTHDKFVRQIAKGWTGDQEGHKDAEDLLLVLVPGSIIEVKMQGAEEKTFIIYDEKKGLLVCDTLGLMNFVNSHTLCVFPAVLGDKK